MGLRAGIWVLALVVPSFGQTTWYVDVQATPPGNGTKQSPYARIQHAIAQPTTQSGDRIYVAPGTYLEAIDLLGKTLVVRGTQGAANTVIDAAGLFSPAITVENGEGEGTRIQGFTITGANPGGVIEGAGLHCDRSTVEVRECAFTDLGQGLPATFRGGGAAVLGGGELVLVRCRFVRCRADQEGGAVYASSSRLRVDGCSFSACTSRFGEGGAIAAYGSLIEVLRCSFQENNANYGLGGALYLELTSGRIADSDLRANRARNGYDGGALATAAGTVEVERCQFFDNAAQAGGALRTTGGVTVRDCRFVGNLAGLNPVATVGGAAIYSTVAQVQVERSVFWRNTTASFSGTAEGAIRGCVLERCTIADNTTTPAASGSAASASTLRDCIVWGNTPPASTLDSCTVTYSDVDAPEPGVGNLSADPLFVDRTGGDLRLLPGSPCIDTGDPSSGPDLDGSRADMGAFPFYPEYGIPPSPGCQGKVNSLGCLPYVGHNGAPPSLSGGLFEVHGHNVSESTYGLLTWSLQPTSVPFQGGTLCVGAPQRRTPVQSSGSFEAGAECPGRFAFRWTSAYLASWGLTAGTDVYCQFWGRDAGDPWNSTMTDLLAFRLVP
jgi:hypothetical protein